MRALHIHKMMERMREESKKQFGLHKEKQSYERPKKKKKIGPMP